MQWQQSKHPFFFQEEETSEESKVHNHFQGHHKCILNVVHLYLNRNTQRFSSEESQKRQKRHNVTQTYYSLLES